MNMHWQPRVISFDTPTHRFNYRAVAVVLHADQVLLHRAESDDCWSVPGGRVESGETASAAVMREMREELALTVTVDRLLWIVENFFSFAGKQHHELGLYFAVTATPDSAIFTLTEPFAGIEQNARLTFAWFSRAELRKIDLRPAFLAEALAREPVQFEHVVNQEMSSGSSTP